MTPEEERRIRESLKEEHARQIEEHRANEQVFRSEQPLEWLQQQPAFCDLGITGVRQIGPRDATYQLIRGDSEPIEIGTSSEINTWRIPQAKIREQAFVQLPYEYGKSKRWAEITEALAGVVKQTQNIVDGGPCEDELLTELIQDWGRAWKDYAYDLNTTEGKLSALDACFGGSHGGPLDFRPLVSTEGEILFQLKDLDNYLKIQRMASWTTYTLGQLLARLGFDRHYNLQARNNGSHPDLPEHPQKTLYRSPKGLLE